MEYYGEEEHRVAAAYKEVSDMESPSQERKYFGGRSEVDSVSSETLVTPTPDFISQFSTSVSCLWSGAWSGHPPRDALRRGGMVAGIVGIDSRRSNHVHGREGWRPLLVCNEDHSASASVLNY